MLRRTTDVVAASMGLKNAGYGTKIEPEGCVALINAWIGDREWTGRLHGFEDAWFGEQKGLEQCMALKNAWL